MVKKPKHKNRSNTLTNSRRDSKNLKKIIKIPVGPINVHCSTIIAKTWKQSQCLWTEERIKRMWYMCVRVCVLSLSVVSESLQPRELYPLGSSVHGNSPGKNTGVGCHALSKPGIELRSPATEIMPFAVTQMSYWVSQTDKGNYLMISLTCGILKKKKDTNELTKQKQRHRYRKQTYAVPQGKTGG